MTSRGFPFLLALLGLVAHAASCAEDPVTPPDASAPPTDAGLEGAVATDADASELPTLSDPCEGAPGVSAAAAWPMAGGCPARPGTRPRLRGPSTSAVATLGDVTGTPTAPVVAADGTAIVGTSDGHVLALPRGGVARWDVTISGAVDVPPVLVSDDVVLVATREGRLHKLAIADGRALGSEASANAPSSLLPLSDGTVVFTAKDTNLHRISVATLTAAGPDSPAFAQTAPSLERGGAVLVAGSDGVLRRFGRDGVTTDVYRAPAPLTESPVSGFSGEILLVSSDGVLRAVTADGKLRYERALGSTASGPPAASPDGNVYIATTGGKVVGVDREGKELFAFEPLGRPEAPSVGAGGTVFFGAEDTKLYAVQPSGRLLFAASLRKRALGAPALGSDGALFVSTLGSIVTVGP